MSTSTATAGLVQVLARERALLFCVLASIALHALVLLGMSRREATAPPRKMLLMLTARLVPLAPAPQPVAPAPHPEPVPPRAPERAPAQRPAQIKPLAAPAPAAPKLAPAEPAKPAPAEVAPAPAVSDSAAQPAGSIQAKAAPQAPAAAPGADAAAKSGTEADTGTLEQYRLALIVAARRYKRYPAIAMEKGWQGRVEVHISIGANGMIASTSIKASSGHELLDNQALDMLKKGKTTVPIPPNLRGREFSIDIPVIFNLENPNS